MRRTLCFFLLFAFTSGALGQDVQHPNQVIVQVSGEDRVGQSLAYAVREKINSSTQMNLVDSATRNVVILKLTTLDPNEGERLEGSNTVFSATWTYSFSKGDNIVELYLSSTAGICGSKRVESIARSLAASTDEQRRSVVEEISELALIWQALGEQ